VIVVTQKLVETSNLPMASCSGLKFAMANAQKDLSYCNSMAEQRNPESVPARYE
jgi:hypothetical protein